MAKTPEALSLPNSEVFPHGGGLVAKKGTPCPSNAEKSSWTRPKLPAGYTADQFEADGLGNWVTKAGAAPAPESVN